VGQDGILRGGCQPPLSLYYAKLNSSDSIRRASGSPGHGYFFGGGADASCFVNLMVIDFFSPEPSFMNSVNM
jgi:hypothetical protein